MTALAHDTQTGWDTPPGQAPGAPRPRLHLVPTGREAQSAPNAAPLRISRFGRLLVTATVVVVAVVLASTLLGTFLGSTFLGSTFLGAGSATAGIDHTVTVTSGQTLSGIADTELPTLPIAEGVAQIQLANQLNTSEVHAGQQLAIPSTG